MSTSDDGISWEKQVSVSFCLKIIFITTYEAGGGGEESYFDAEIVTRGRISLVAACQSYGNTNKRQWI